MYFDLGIEKQSILGNIDFTNDLESEDNKIPEIKEEKIIDKKTFL